MSSVSLTLRFTARLGAALLLGSAVGLEREWRQRMAGTRTNALVSAGAAAFVMSAILGDGDPAAPGRIASYVVSGVGFLGAGVIFKDGANIRGLNTAATVWCSAAIGVLAGYGAPHLSLLLAVAVLLTNTALRPLAYRLHPVLPEATPVETVYEISLTCRINDEAQLRTLLLTTITQSAMALQSIHSQDIESIDRMLIRALLSTYGRRNEVAEEIVRRLLFEPGVSAVSWRVATANVESEIDEHLLDQ
ncbi:MgtC/SapB family protein [Edaphobacter bradus]|uniref:MgtC/SapB family protein n=1 Tax=Edaphobacter bradus TaxID=2259016 RepID=UPI0021E00CB0|nr:MgtC/SapB family protein [Edaphobacter bradus]